MSIMLAHCFVVTACLGSSIERKTERKESAEVKKNFPKNPLKLNLYSFPKISISKLFFQNFLIWKKTPLHPTEALLN